MFKESTIDMFLFEQTTAKEEVKSSCIWSEKVHVWRKLGMDGWVKKAHNVHYYLCLV